MLRGSYDVNLFSHLFRQKMRMLPSELPIYFGAFIVSGFLPCGRFSFDSLNIVYSSIQALTDEHIQFDFRHV